MDNPQTMTTLGIQETRRKETKQQHKTKKTDEQHCPIQNLEVNTGVRKGFYKNPIKRFVYLKEL